MSLGQHGKATEFFTGGDETGPRPCLEAHSCPSAQLGRSQTGLGLSQEFIDLLFGEHVQSPAVGLGLQA